MRFLTMRFVTSVLAQRFVTSALAQRNRAIAPHGWRSESMKSTKKRPTMARWSPADDLP
jgi:hypothetical protein